MLLTQAVLRLTPLAIEPLTAGTLTLAQGAIYGLWVVVNGYAEGYRAFQLRFVPRVVARAFELGRRPRSAIHLLLAPAFAMSLFHATKRSRIVAWCVLLGVAGLVILVRNTPQPWRGIVDGGVVVGLGWGLVALVFEVVAALRLGPRPAPDLPENDRAPATPSVGVTADA